jgi:hypothetical protein
LTSPASETLLALRAQAAIEPDQAAVVIARPLGVPVYGAPGALAVPSAPPYDGYAIASLGLGLTGIIPIISQVVGIWLGVASLRRLRRGLQTGEPRRGAWMAWLGLTFNGAGLMGWIAVIAILGWVTATVGESAATLNSVVPR